jgi:hypothetical protein
MSTRETGTGIIRFLIDLVSPCPVFGFVGSTGLGATGNTKQVRAAYDQSSFIAALWAKGRIDHACVLFTRLAKIPSPRT